MSIAQDSSFEDVRYEIETESARVEIPATLEVGAWYWKVSDMVGGSWISREIQSVEVVPQLSNPPAAVLESSYNLQRPRLLLSKERVASIVKTHPGDSRHIGNRCDAVVGSNLPEDVTRRELDSGKRAEYRKTWSELSPAMLMTEVCAVAFQLTNKKKYRDESIRRLRHFVRWDQDGVSNLKVNDTVAMMMLTSGVRSFDLLFDELDEELKADLSQSLRDRARRAFSYLTESVVYHENPRNSHANRLLGFVGEAALVFIDDWPEASEYLEYVISMFGNVYPAWASQDGGWNEGPTYWAYYMSYAFNFLVPLKRVTGVDLFQRPFFENTGYYKLYSNPPNSGFSPFGDGEHRGPLQKSGDVMYILGNMLDNDDFRLYAKRMRATGGYQAVSLGVQGTSEPISDGWNLPEARFFPGAGLVSIHTEIDDLENDIRFLFRSSPMPAQSHSHPDQNSFALEVGSHPLAIASGYYPSYGSPHHKMWQRQSLSSNTITIDGGEGQRWGPNSTGAEVLSFEQTGSLHYFSGDASGTYPKLSKFVRHVVHIKPGIFVIHDQLESNGARQYEWNLHSFNPIKIDPTAKMAWLKNGPASAQVKFHSPLDLAMEVSDKFTVPPEDGNKDQWHLRVSNPSRAMRSRFTTLLMVNSNGAARVVEPVSVEYARSQTVVKVKLSDQEVVLAFRDGPGDELMSAGEFVTSRDVGMWSTVDGETTESTIDIDR